MDCLTVKEVGVRARLLSRSKSILGMTLMTRGMGRGKFQFKDGLHMYSRAPSHHRK